MANCSAADVKKLRDLTGAGMMDCKKALEEADGDFDKAVEILRVKAGAKVQKRAGERTASNGLIAAAEGAMIELACETDFVAKGEDFQTLAGDIVTHLADSERVRGVRRARTTRPGWPSGCSRTPSRTAAPSPRTSTRSPRIIGEMIELRRAVKLSGQVATYLHKKASDLPPQVGVLVQFDGSDLAAARGAAMQIAAMRPRYLAREDVPADAIENERRVLEAKAREEGKPEAALPKIVEGMLNGFFKDNVLLEQSSVQDNKKTVKALLAEAGVTPLGFAHFEIGAPERVGQDRRRPVRRERSRNDRARGCCGSFARWFGRAAGLQPGAAQAVGRGVRRRSGRGRPGHRRLVARQIAEVVATGVAGRDRRRWRQLLPRRRAVRSAAWTAAAPTTWACSARS